MAFPLSWHKLPSAGALWILVNMHTSLLSRHSIVVKSALVLMRMSPLFSFVVFGFRSSEMPFLFGLTVPQQQIGFFAKSSNNSGEEKKLSMYNLWSRPSIFLVSSVTVAWVAVTCYAVHCLSFPRYTFMSYVYSVESQSLNILMPKRLRFFGMYCLKITFPLKGT